MILKYMTSSRLFRESLREPQAQNLGRKKAPKAGNRKRVDALSVKTNH